MIKRFPGVSAHFVRSRSADGGETSPTFRDPAADGETRRGKVLKRYRRRNKKGKRARRGRYPFCVVPQKRFRKTRFYNGKVERVDCEKKNQYEFREKLTTESVKRPTFDRR